MNTRHGTLAILAVLSLATAGNLFAQRRSTSGGGSSGRSTPSGGGSGSSGGSRSSGGSSGGSRSAGGSSGSSGRSSGSSGASGASTTRARNASGNTQPSVRGTTSSASQPSTSASTPTVSGKIGAIKRNARAVTAATHSGGGVYYGGGVYVGGCFNCGYWGYYGPAWGWYDYGWWYPAHFPYDPHRDYDEPSSASTEGETSHMEHVELGQGYMPYPYAESDGTGETFIQQHSSGHHSYGALTVSYFKDQGSTTQAGHVQFETAIKAFHFNMGYDQYVEPVQGRTDRLHTGRAAIGAQLPVGGHAYLIAGVGGRGVWLDDHQDAYGPEGTLGLQIFPGRPLGLNVTGRVAQMSWTGHDWFTMTEVNTTGSVFLWHLELQGGWHWMQMEGSPAFGGPMVGTRFWF